MFIAHKNNIDIQTVATHLRNVSHISSIFADKIGLSNCGKLIGLMHDVGKYTDAFQVHINSENSKQGPDHSTAGAILLCSFLSEKSKQFEKTTAHMLSIIIMSHHGGLIDFFDEGATSPFLNRIEKHKISSYKDLYEQSISNFLKEFDRVELEKLFALATEEIISICDKILIAGLDRFYALGMISKFLFSCLIDADRYDTAMYMDGKNTNFDFQSYDFSEHALTFEEKLKSFTDDSTINKARKILSDNCKKNSKRKNGTYTLSCPTGSGKTFSSLRFALNHAVESNKSRIFYIIPFLSIIEQNSAEISKILDLDDDNKILLELHSAKENSEEKQNELDKSGLLTERLECPMVITSMVRFLNIFFAKGTKNTRPLHQFANSIIIFDEIQTISPQHISLFTGAINFLQNICNATVILSTATKPALDNKEAIKYPVILSQSPELSEITPEILETFKRTNYIDKISEIKTLEETTDFVLEKLTISDNLLVILNTKSAVETLYNEIKDRCSVPIFILTTNLYPLDRKEKLAEIRKKLKCEKVLVLSTQLIEAGVDISFHCVIRSLAGLDSVIQSAGRCNRHAEYEFGNVYLISPDFEYLSSLPTIKDGRDTLEWLLRQHKKSPEILGCIDSREAIEKYFEQFYHLQKANLEYAITLESGTKTSIYSLLSANTLLKKQAQSNLGLAPNTLILPQSFRLASKEFEAISTYGTPVIVSHGEAVSLISKLQSDLYLSEKYTILRKLQLYTVNLALSPKFEGAIYHIEDVGVSVLREGYYDPILGVTDRAIDVPLLNF